jgi:hypothetical protein
VLRGGRCGVRVEVTDAACFLGLLDDLAALGRYSGLPGSLTGTS